MLLEFFKIGILKTNSLIQEIRFYLEFVWDWTKMYYIATKQDETQ